MSYFVPDSNIHLKKIPPIIKNALSDELFDAIHKMQYGKDGEPLGDESTQWIYLMDCVSRGTISPMDAYDCIKLGHVPEHLHHRKSAYKIY